MSYHAFVCPKTQKRYGSFEVFEVDTPIDYKDPFTDDDSSGLGWYWDALYENQRTCGAPIGPFRTEGRAIADALKHGQKKREV